MPTTGTTPVSTTDDNPKLLLPSANVKIEEIFIDNSNAASADGYWSIGATGEKRKLPVGSIGTYSVCNARNAEIYIHRKAGGANLVGVEAYTLP